MYSYLFLVHMHVCVQCNMMIMILLRTSLFSNFSQSNLFCYLAVPFSKINSTINSCVEKCRVDRLCKPLASLGDCFKLLRSEIWNTSVESKMFWAFSIMAWNAVTLSSQLLCPGSDAIAHSKIKLCKLVWTYLRFPFCWRQPSNLMGSCCVRIWYYYQLHYLCKFLW